MPLCKFAFFCIQMSNCSGPTQSGKIQNFSTFNRVYLICSVFLNPIYKEIRLKIIFTFFFTTQSDYFCVFLFFRISARISQDSHRKKKLFAKRENQSFLYFDEKLPGHKFDVVYQRTTGKYNFFLRFSPFDNVPFYNPKFSETDIFHLINYFFGKTTAVILFKKHVKRLIPPSLPVSKIEFFLFRLINQQISKIENI